MESKVLGKIEWSASKESATIVLRADPKTTLVLRPIEHKEAWIRELTATLGLEGDVSTDSAGAALPLYSTIQWRDEPMLTGLTAVELRGEADGLALALVKPLKKPANSDDPEVAAAFEELRRAREDILRPAMLP